MGTSKYEITLSIKKEKWDSANLWFEKHAVMLISVFLAIISIVSFIYYYQNGLGLAYNDARSHLDIGRRVVEGLKPGVAQLGSVWLPLTHILMALTVWNDFMWHSGLSGAIQSMIAFVGTGLLIYLFIRELGADFFSGILGVAIFAANLNVLYLQSTAMTELALLGTMTAGAYYSLLWYKKDRLIHLILAAFWVMLSTLVRYDGWFLLLSSAILLFLFVWKKSDYKKAEGILILFFTLGGVGIGLWFLWNQVIFKDALYFIFGPYSAYAQQKGLESAGVLVTKKNLFFSFQVYLYALAYNSGALIMVLGFIGAIALWLDKKIAFSVRLATVLLITPFVFNVVALYMGHSVLFVQGLSGNSLFNVRYGIMMMPSFAIFIGYLFTRLPKMKFVLFGLIVFITTFSFISADAVTIDDARIGSSQKNVTEVSGWLKNNAKDNKGFVLISVASHDSIIFTSGLPMKKFIHEGSGDYYDAAVKNPQSWARWIVMRTNSTDDSTWKAMMDNSEFKNSYELVDHYPFADIYQLKGEYLKDLITEPILKQK